MTTKDSHDVLTAWESSSKFWNKHQVAIEKMFAPLTGALSAEAGIRPGHSILDVGGGSGEPSLTLATVTGPAGSVTYTDPAAGMVHTARSEADRRGLRNIAFEQISAECLLFPDHSFDVVVGRLSAMFFENPNLAIGEILRVTKPEGRFAFLVWGPRENNPFFAVMSDVLNQFLPADPEDEDAPGAFRFAKSGKLASLFRNAGATTVTEHTFSFNIEHPIDIEQFWQLRTELSDTYRSKLAQLSSAQLADAKRATASAVAKYFEGGHMNFPAQVLIVSGQK